MVKGVLVITKGLRQIFKIKHTVIKEILKNKELVTVLKQGREISDKSLVNTQIFPFFYIPMTKKDNYTTTESKAFIFMRVYANRIKERTVENFNLEIGIISNKDNMIYKNGMPITDVIVGYLEPLVTSLKDIGIDSPILTSIMPYNSQIADFDGYVLQFSIPVVHNTYGLCGD